MRGAQRLRRRSDSAKHIRDSEYSVSVSHRISERWTSGRHATSRQSALRFQREGETHTESAPLSACSPSLASQPASLHVCLLSR